MSNVLNIKELSTVPVEGIAYKSNLSSYKGSVHGGSDLGTFDGFLNLVNWIYQYNPIDGTLTTWKENVPDDTHIIFENIFNIQEISFTFDKQMLFVAAYVRDNKSYLYYFDSSVNEYTVKEIAEAANPKVALSSVHFSHASSSSVVLAYVRDNRKLCVRLQEDRYTIEYIVNEFSNKIKLFNIGYATTNRFQYEVLESVV